MLQISSEVVPVALLESFLSRPRGNATPEECHAWEDFFLIHVEIIQATARRSHRSCQVMEDITQDVLVAVVEVLANPLRARSLGSITAWVVKTADRIARRHAHVRSKRKQESMTADAREHLIDPEPGPDEEFDRWQNEEDLRRVIEEYAELLSARDRLFVVRHWREGRSLSAIAAELAVSEDAAWGVMRRVSLGLADYLRRHGYGDS